MKKILEHVNNFLAIIVYCFNNPQYTLLKQKLKLILFLLNMQAISKSSRYMYAVIVFSIFLNGWYVASYGPLIPQFSSVTGLDETDYSYLFFVRSVANIAGGVFIKYLLKKCSLNSIYLGSSITVGLSLLGANYSLSTFNLTIYLFFASLAFVISLVIYFDVSIRLFRQQASYYMQLVNIVFGAGAMCGPYLVGICKLDTFKVIALCQLSAIFVLLKNPIPNFSQGQTQKDLTEQKMMLGKKSALLIAIVLFFYATLELGVASWISTYAIKAGVSDVEGSAFYSILFWAPNCFFRLVWIYIPGTIQYRIYLALKLSFATMVLGLIFQYAGWFQLVCIFVPILMGLLTAGLYCLCVSLPADNGFANNPQNSANFVLGNSLGEGLLLMPIGYSIHLFGFEAFMVEIFVFSFLCLLSFREAAQSMRKDQQDYEDSLLSEMK